jgi:hypothetical protein
LHTISGRVTSANGRPAQVRIKLSGSKKETAATDGEGRYAFDRLPAGDYVVAPIEDGLIFEPRGYSFGNLSRNESANFRASERPPDVLYSISGRVTSNGRPAQARIRLMGKRNAIASTDGEGNYRFDGLPAGSYMVAPVADRLNFEPRSRLIVQLNRNETANFVAIERQADVISELFEIRGRVTFPIGQTAQMRIRLDGTKRATTVVEADGNYVFSRLPAGDYVVTPFADGMSFEPRSRSFMRLSRNERANFVAIGRRIVDKPRDDAPRESPKPTPTRRRPVPNRSP